ncbi:MAG: sugar kinase [Clostridia bacterium]|nr:sugar kinase [Clostridia bacterium]
MAKVVTFGEIMLRLQPPEYKRFLQATSFDVVYGGGEANVAISLAQYGDEVAYVTKLPDNPIGQACLNEIRKWGVNTAFIARGGARLGIYFCEKGASQRPSNVVYDRAGSSIATSTVADFDWDKIFEGVDWFHFTGITPALGDNVAESVLAACKAAKARGIRISCDLNYRKKLWTKEKAGQVMGNLMQYVDLLIANEEDCSDVFGIKASGTDIETGKLSTDGYKDVCRQIEERFGIKTVAITLRESISASQNGWSGMLCSDGEFYFSDRYMITIVDRVGGGDSFGAGLIHSLANGKDPQYAISFAVAASCLKHTVEGDYNVASEKEVLNLVKGGGSGRVQR